MKSPIVAAALVLSSAGAVAGANRFAVPDRLLPEDHQGSVLLECEHDVDMLAFSFSFAYDETLVDISAVTFEGTSLDVAGDPPDFYSGTFEDGEVIFGCLIAGLDDSNPRAGALPAGVHSIGRIDYRVLAGAGAEIDLEFRDGLGGGAVESRNVITNLDGESVLPELDSGRFSIVDSVPVAIRVVDSAGVAIGDPGLAIGLAAQVTWGSTFESATWEAIRMTLSGSNASLDRVDSVALWIDENGDGAIDAGDREIAREFAIPRGAGNIELVIDETLAPGASLSFLVGIDTDAAPLSSALPILLVVALAAAAIAGRSARRNAAILPVAVLPIAILLAALAACSSGGGDAPQALSVKIAIEGPDDVVISGDETGLPGELDGFPVEGPAVDVD